MIIYNQVPSFNLKKIWASYFVLIAIINVLIFYNIKWEFRFVLLFAMLFTVAFIFAIILIVGNVVVSVKAFFSERFIEIHFCNLIGKSSLINISFEELAYNIETKNIPRGVVKFFSIYKNKVKVASIKIFENTSEERNQFKNLIDNFKAIK